MPIEIDKKAFRRKSMGRKKDQDAGRQIGHSPRSGTAQERPQHARRDAHRRSSGETISVSRESRVILEKTTKTFRRALRRLADK